MHVQRRPADVFELKNGEAKSHRILWDFCVNTLENCENKGE